MSGAFEYKLFRMPVEIKLVNKILQATEVLRVKIFDRNKGEISPNSADKLRMVVLIIQVFQ